MQFGTKMQHGADNGLTRRFSDYNVVVSVATCATIAASSLDMHYLVFGINFQIPFVSLASLVIYFLIRCQVIFVIITTLSIHYFLALSLQAQNLPLCDAERDL